MFSVLFAALSMLGQTPQTIGIPSEFWCQSFVSAVIAEAGHTGGGTSPGNVMATLVETSAQPGAVVAIDLFPGNDTTEHVAIVESVNADGSVNTIEGNGPDPDRVVRSVRQPEEVLSYGITPETHAEYLHGLCTQLQEVKYWIDWECS